MFKQITLYRVLLLFLLPLLAAGCKTSDCPGCKEVERTGKQMPARWNIVLKNSVTDPCTGQKITSIKTDLNPIFVPETDYVRTCCDSALPFLDAVRNYQPGDDFSKLPGYIRTISVTCPSEINIPTDNILEITNMGNPLTPSEKVWRPTEPCLCCDRVRNGWWIFDKLELKGMLGFRAKPDSVHYPAAVGQGTTYGPSFAGTDRGGSVLLYGIEINAMWSVKFIDKSEKFQVGVMTGLWPVDGSTFFPVALHGRYTFNQKPNPFSNNCNSWLLFGDIGVPVDFQSKADYFGKRYFFDFGAGYDFVIDCKRDFTIDLGYRYMSLPLPQITCCPDLPNDLKNPYRRSNLLFIRFGLTF